jgi:methyl-accepting chemotaxis protein
MKNLSIKWKVLLFIILSISCVSIIAIAVSSYNLKELGNKEIAKFKEEAYKERKQELKSYIKIVEKSLESYHKRTSKEMLKNEVRDKLHLQSNFLIELLNGFYNKNKNILSEAKMQEELLNIVKSARYGDSGYFWINDMQPKMIMHPIKPALDGRDLSNLKDPNGKKLFVEFVKAVKSGNGQGFVDYMWSKPGFDKPQDKISYVFVFKPYNWIIGTGEYVDNITEKLQKEALSTIATMRYGSDSKGYFWINDMAPNIVMHPIKPSLNGTNVSNIKDPSGKRIFVEFVKAVQKDGSGFVNYSWSKPGFDKPQRKISFVKNFKEWNWIIGTGVYVDDIEAKIAEMQKITDEEISSTIVSFILINTAIVLIVLVFIFIFTNSTIVRPLEEFLKGLESFFRYLNKESDVVNTINIDSKDEIGQIAKKVNENIAISKDRIVQNQALLDDVKDVFSKVEKGSLEARVSKNSSDESLNELKELINEVLEYLNSAISNDINEITHVLDEYARHNYIPVVNSQKGKVANNVNLLGETITKMLVESKHRAEILQDGSQELTRNVEHIYDTANHQAASLEETASSIEEIVSNIQQTVDKSQAMSKNADETKESADSGKSLALKTAEAMDEIQNQTKRINESIDAIDQVAFQTNILSLNAAVEAATAGEAGKGFAVVAGEVRNLASRSADTAKIIKEIVELATSKTNEGKDISDKMLNEFINLNDKITDTSSMLSDIAQASKEQMLGVEQISDVINGLDKISQDSVKIASATNDIAVKTSKVSSEIVANTESKEFRGKN